MAREDPARGGRGFLIMFGWSRLIHARIVQESLSDSATHARKFGKISEYWDIILQSNREIGGFAVKPRY